MNKILPQVRNRMMEKGWFLEVDLVSALIVVMLAVVLLTANFLRSSDRFSGPPPAPVPMAAQPRPEDLQTTPIPLPGQQPAPGEGEGQEGEGETGDMQGSGAPENDGDGPGDQPGGEQPGSGSTGDQGALEDALRQLGESLSGQAGTNELGEALQDLDLGRAADALDDLSGELDDLSRESQENLSEALEDAAEALQEAGEPALGQNMDEAAESMGNEGGEAEEALGEVAEDMRDLAGQMDSSGTASGAGEGNGQAQAGNPEPLPRLSGEEGEMSLPLTDTEQSGLLNSSPPQGEGEGTASGSLDATGRDADDSAQSPLLPNTFLWKWRDVVSQYFQR